MKEAEAELEAAKFAEWNENEMRKMACLPLSWS